MSNGYIVKGGTAKQSKAHERRSLIGTQRVPPRHSPSHQPQLMENVSGTCPSGREATCCVNSSIHSDSVQNHLHARQTESGTGAKPRSGKDEKL